MASPFREPLIKFLNRYAIHSVKYFLVADRMQVRLRQTQTTLFVFVFLSNDGLITYLPPINSLLGYTTF
jgi:hypothetical protein